MLLVPRLYTVDVLYYRPHSRILQQFVWQCHDLPPSLPKIHHFFDFWHNNIEAIIADINIFDSNAKIIFFKDEFQL
jgi:uncharacterized protein Usg